MTVHGQPTLYAAGYSSYLGRLLGVMAVSAVLIWLAQRYFARVQGSFAQEL